MGFSQRYSRLTKVLSGDVQASSAYDAHAEVSEGEHESIGNGVGLVAQVQTAPVGDFQTARPQSSRSCDDKQDRKPLFTARHGEIQSQSKSLALCISKPFLDLHAEGNGVRSRLGNPGDSLLIYRCQSADGANRYTVPGIPAK